MAERRFIMGAFHNPFQGTQRAGDPIRRPPRGPLYEVELVSLGLGWGFRIHWRADGFVVVDSAVAARRGDRYNGTRIRSRYWTAAAARSVANDLVREFLYRLTEPY